MRPDEFIRGYACAVATLALQRGECDLSVEEVAACGLPMDEAKLRELGVDESDIQELRYAIAQHKRKRGIEEQPRNFAVQTARDQTRFTTCNWAATLEEAIQAVKRLSSAYPRRIRQGRKTVWYECGIRI